VLERVSPGIAADPDAEAERGSVETLTLPELVRLSDAYASSVRR